MTDKKSGKGYTPTNFWDRFLHPNFWSPEQFCSFFEAARDFLKDDIESQAKNVLQTEIDSSKHIFTNSSRQTHVTKQSPRRDQFGLTDAKLYPQKTKLEILIDNLNQKAVEQKVLGPYDNWAIELGKDHLEKILFRYVNGVARKPKEYISKDYDIKTFEKHSKVTVLIFLIRDKKVHRGDVLEKVREELQWHKEDWIVHYVQYWITKFPKLAIFLWKELAEYRDNTYLKKFYIPVDTTISSFPLEHEQLMEEIEQELLKDMHTGGVTEMFECDNLTLEFREMEAKRLLAILPKGCPTMMIGHALSSEQPRMEQRVIWDMEPVPDLRFIKSGALSRTLVVVTRDAKASASFILEQTQNINASSSSVEGMAKFVKPDKLIIITGSTKNKTKSKIAKGLANTIEYRNFCWMDLHLVNLRSIQFDSMHILLNNLCVPLANILPSNWAERVRILQKLQGSQLISLLRNENPKLFRLCEAISLPDVYICREYKHAYIVDFQKLINLGSKKDIFVVKNETSECLQVDEPAVFFKQSEEDFKLEIKSRSDKHSQYNHVHYLTYIGSGKCTWRYTKGCDKIFTAYAQKYDTQKMSEDEFLEQVPNHRVGVFTDRAGHGKTVATILTSLHAERYINVFLRAKDIVLQFKQSFNLEDESLLTFLLEQTCETEFEKELLRWNSRTNEPKLQLLVVLDGFDESNEGGRHLLLRALEMTLNTFRFVKFLVSVRNYVDNEIRESFDASFYTMELFTETQQLDYLARYWKHYLELKGNSKTQSEEELRELAQKCCKVKIIRDNADLLGIPLMSKILATIIEEELDEFNFSKLQNISDLYKQFVHRQIQRYFLEKQNVTGLDLESPYGKPAYENICQRHVYYALKLVVGDEAGVWFKLAFPKCDSDEKYILDLGMVENIEKLRFVHRTFAEYFLALFFAKVASGEWNQIQISDTTYQQILWEELLSVDKERKTFLYPVFCEFFNLMLFDIKPAEEFELFLTNLSRNDSAETVPYERMELDWDFQSILESLKKLSDDYIRIAYFGGMCSFTIVKQIGIGLVMHDRVDFLNVAIDRLSVSHLEKIRFSHKFYYYVTSNLSLEDNLTILHIMFSQIANRHNTGGENLRLCDIQNFVDCLRKKVGSSVFQLCLEEKSSHGRTPLAYLVGQNTYQNSETLDCVKWLVQDLKANVFTADNEGNTLLHHLAYAICRKIPVGPRAEKTKLPQKEIYVHLWKYFLETGLLYRSKNLEGETPYHIVLNQHFKNTSIDEILSMLKPGDEVINMKDNYESDLFMTALDNIYCVEENCVKLVSLANSVESCRKGVTPLHGALLTNFTSFYTAFLEKKYGPNGLLNIDKILDNYGQSLLYYAGFMGSSETVKLVLSKSTYSLDMQEKLLRHYEMLLGNVGRRSEELYFTDREKLRTGLESFRILLTEQNLLD